MLAAVLEPKYLNSATRIADQITHALTRDVFVRRTAVTVGCLIIGTQLSVRRRHRSWLRPLARRKHYEFSAHLKTQLPAHNKHDHNTDINLRSGLTHTMAKYPTMDWIGENIAESFKKFKQQMTLILIDENVVDPAK